MKKDIIVQETKLVKDPSVSKNHQPHVEMGKLRMENNVMMVSLILEMDVVLNVKFNLDGNVVATLAIVFTNLFVEMELCRQDNSVMMEICIMVMGVVIIAEFKAIGNVIVLLLEEFQHAKEKPILNVVMELENTAKNVMMETIINTMDVIIVSMFIIPLLLPHLNNSVGTIFINQTEDNFVITETRQAVLIVILTQDITVSIKSAQPLFVILNLYLHLLMWNNVVMENMSLITISIVMMVIKIMVTDAQGHVGKKMVIFVQMSSILYLTVMSHMYVNILTILSHTLNYALKPYKH